MKTSFKTLMFICTIFLLNACTNKVDSALNKGEKALDKYEAKQKSGKVTRQDFMDLQTEMSTITMEFKNDINSSENQVTPQQQQRGRELAERYASIMVGNSFGNN